MNNLLGPKGSDSPTRADVIFDLHNTVANTGVLLLLHSNDVFAHQIAQHIVKHHPQGRFSSHISAESSHIGVKLGSESGQTESSLFYQQ